MVSEGVDVPRLCVGVYATSTSTPLFFAQAVGRFVRARRRGETASVFLPSVPVILTHAATMEEERDHALDRPSSDEDEASLWAEEEGMLAAANRTEKTVGPRGDVVRGAGVRRALRPRALRRQAVRPACGGRVGGGAGLPRAAGAPRARAGHHPAPRAAGEADQGRGRARWGAGAGPTPVSAHRALASQRKELNKLVAAYSSKTGTPHASIHLDLRRACGGPELAAATSEQVLERMERIRRWFVGRR